MRSCPLVFSWSVQLELLSCSPCMFYWLSLRPSSTQSTEQLLTVWLTLLSVLPETVSSIKVEVVHPNVSFSNWDILTLFGLRSCHLQLWDCSFFLLDGNTWKDCRLFEECGASPQHSSNFLIWMLNLSTQCFGFVCFSTAGLGWICEDQLSRWTVHWEVEENFACRSGEKNSGGRVDYSQSLHAGGPSSEQIDSLLLCLQNSF